MVLTINNSTKLSACPTKPTRVISRCTRGQLLKSIPQECNASDIQRNINTNSNTNNNTNGNADIVKFYTKYTNIL